MSLELGKELMEKVEAQVKIYLAALEADSEDEFCLSDEDLRDMMHDSRHDGDFADAAACALALDIYYSNEEKGEAK